MKKINTHMTLSDRIVIEQGLRDGKSFKDIAAIIQKDATTVSKEIRRAVNSDDWKTDPVDCFYVDTCRETHLCISDCTSFCKYCSAVDCTQSCSRWKPKHCNKLKKAPYVCNACPEQIRCKLRKKYYHAKDAQKMYEKKLSKSRQGINMTAAELRNLNELITPLIQQNQSLSHIYANHEDEIGICRKTLYNYIDSGALSVRNIDLPRKVRYKKRKKTQQPVTRDFSYRSGRTYKEFQNHLSLNPDVEVIEMDTVKGTQEKGKCLLTMMFRTSRLMLIFVLNRCTMADVVNVFDRLTDLLGLEIFRDTFPVILTDNGPEFKDSKGLEYTRDGNKRTSVFYCDSLQSNQKARLERNHELIRYIIPKGISMYWVTQEHATLMANHINSLSRDSLNSHTPYEVAELLLKKEVLNQLHLTHIPADQVQLNPALLKK